MTLPWGEFAEVWLFLAANIATPGPNVLNTVALALGSGRAAGMGSAAGVGLGIGLWCLGMVLGVATVVTVLPGAQAALRVAAVALLLWFAARYWRAAWRGFREQSVAVAQGQGGAGFATGFRRALVVSAVNPKALTTWLAVLGMFPVQAAGPEDVAILCAGACAASVAIHGIYVILFSTARAARLSLRFGWVLQALAGSLFAGFALRLVAGG
jgi:threonine/homoserine/homoserine lactone efflux protein